MSVQPVQKGTSLPYFRALLKLALDKEGTGDKQALFFVFASALTTKLLAIVSEALKKTKSGTCVQSLQVAGNLPPRTAIFLWKAFPPLLLKIPYIDRFVPSFFSPLKTLGGYESIDIGIFSKRGKGLPYAHSSIA